MMYNKIVRALGRGQDFLFRCLSHDRGESGSRINFSKSGTEIADFSERLCKAIGSFLVEFCTADREGKFMFFDVV